MSGDKRTIKHWKEEAKKLAAENDTLKKENDHNIKGKKIDSFWNKLAIFISFLVFIVMAFQGFLMREQTKIFEDQLDLISHQDSLFEKQTLEIEKQNQLIANQNELFGNQILIDSIQTEVSQGQNDLIKNQNFLIGLQNDKIDLQSNLIEADRRSGVIILFNSLIEKIDKELSTQNDNNRILQKLTVDRIVSLSISLKPYFYLSDGKNTKNFLSPERGQLLVFLLNSNLDRKNYSEIFKKGNFQYADLQNTYLEDFELSGIDLKYANFDGAYLNNLSFLGTDLSNTNFQKVKSYNCKFINSKISNSNFSESYHFNTKFLSCKLNNIDFSNSSMRVTYFNTDSGINKIKQYNIKDFIKYQNILLASTKKTITPSDYGFKDYVLNNKNKQMRFYAIGSRDDEYYTVYKNLNFHNTDLSNSIFENVFFENSNFNNSTLSLISCLKVAFYKCQLNKIKSNLFTLKYIFKKEIIYPIYNEDFKVIQS